MSDHKFPRFPQVQRAILAEIERPDFNAALPPLSDNSWLAILKGSQWQYEENDRLEFLGDALMYATIGRLLYPEIPLGTPALYSTLRAALHSNQTFSRLAEKLDILAVSSHVLKVLTAKTFGEGTSAPSKSRGQVKATADLFETIIGTYFNEAGFEALCEWTKSLYKTLILAAKKAYMSSQPAIHARNPPPVLRPRVYSPMRPAALFIKPKRSLAVHKVTVNIKNPIKVAIHRTVPSSKQRSSRPSKLSQTSASTRNATVQPIVIDLTNVEDSDMELGSDTHDGPSAAPLVLAEVAPSSHLTRSSAERLANEEQEDRYDEQYLEAMLIAGN